VALDDHRLLDAVVEELPEILPSFGSGHGFHQRKVTTNCTKS
jgi:hypothetical protein